MFQNEELKFLEKLGFKVNPNYKLCDSINEAINVWENWHDKKDKENYLDRGFAKKIVGKTETIIEI